MSVLAKLVGGPAEGKLITVPSHEPIVISRSRSCPHIGAELVIDRGRYVARPDTPIQSAFVTAATGVARIFDWDGWQPA